MKKNEFLPSAVVRTLLLLGLIWFLYLIRDIVLIIFIAIAFSSVFSPWVDWFERKYRLRRGVSVTGLFLIFFGAVGGFLQALIPVFLEEGKKLFTQLPVATDDFLTTFRLQEFINHDQASQITETLSATFNTQLNALSGDIFKFGAGLFDNFLTLVTLVVLTVYLTLEHEKVKDFIIGLFRSGANNNSSSKAERILDRVENKLGAWIRGQALLMVTIGLSFYIALTVLQINFALPLAVLGGILEIVPIVGPLIAVIPAVLVGATISPIKALSIALAYLLIQQLEGHILVPRVMNQTVGLDPIAVIIALMIGAKLAGPIGGLLAVPVAAVLLIVYEEWQANRNSAEAMGIVTDSSLFDLDEEIKEDEFGNNHT